MTSERPFARYEVNVLVDNKGLKGAPVVVETNPTYHNLTGRIEHQATWGGVLTDHMMIKPGALHRANGGYLIISARECLLNPFAWEGLKRALKDRALRIEEIGVQQGLAHTVTLAPESVSLDIKTVLIGNPQIYYLLYAYDEDFQKLFKVKAEFATRMERTPNSERAYALFVSTITQLDQSLPFDRGAVARVIEYGSRVAEDQDELSTRFGEIADLIRESGYHAGKNSHQAVTSEDVKTAEEARQYRQNLAEERLQEALVQRNCVARHDGIGCRSDQWAFCCRPGGLCIRTSSASYGNRWGRAPWCSEHRTRSGVKRSDSWQRCADPQWIPAPQVRLERSTQSILQPSFRAILQHGGRR